METDDGIDHSFDFDPSLSKILERLSATDLHRFFRDLDLMYFKPEMLHTCCSLLLLCLERRLRVRLLYHDWLVAHTGKILNLDLKCANLINTSYVWRYCQIIRIWDTKA